MTSLQSSLDRHGISQEYSHSRYESGTDANSCIGLRLPQELIDYILELSLTHEHPIVDPLPPDCNGAVRFDMLHDTGMDASQDWYVAGAPRWCGLRFPKTPPTTYAIASLPCPSDCPFHIKLLLLNHRCYANAQRVMIESNRFVFISIESLYTFATRLPEVARWVRKITLVLSVHQISAWKVYDVAGADTNLIWHTQNPKSMCLDEPRFVSEPSMVAQEGRGEQRLSTYFLNLKNLQVHVQDWRQEELSISPADRARLVSLGPAAHVPWVRMKETPRRIVRGANLEEWFEKLAGGGWKAQKAEVTGMEDHADQCLVTSFEQMLTK